ncbi:MAG: glycosyltransferase [Planctomycetota bacterium]
MPRELAICLATYRRPLMLSRLLGSLERAVIPEGTRVHLRIVDNDAKGSAREVVERLRWEGEGRGELVYDIEPEQNIALTRNRAVERGPADLVLFVDDDEVVPEDWLRAHLRVLDDSGADAVFGPVDGRLPAGAPLWLYDEAMFNKETGPDGTRLDWRDTRTSNTLVRGRWFYGAGYRFDPSFGRSGSSDTDLFKRMEEAGASYVSADSARVWEDVEPERANLRWLLKRYYRNGLTFHRLQGRGSSKAKELARFAARAARMLVGIAAHAPAFVLGRPGRLYRTLCSGALAWGGFVALRQPTAARSFVEYGKRAGAATPPADPAACGSPDSKAQGSESSRRAS